MKHGETQYEMLVKYFTYFMELFEPVFYYVFGDTLTEISNSAVQSDFLLDKIEQNTPVYDTMFSCNI